MMTPSKENIFLLTDPLWGESIGTLKGQWHGASTFFFDLYPNKRLSKNSTRPWLETSSRFNDATVMKSALVLARKCDQMFLPRYVNYRVVFDRDISGVYGIDLVLVTDVHAYTYMHRYTHIYIHTYIYIYNLVGIKSGPCLLNHIINTISNMEQEFYHY